MTIRVKQYKIVTKNFLRIYKVSSDHHRTWIRHFAFWSESCLGRRFPSTSRGTWCQRALRFGGNLRYRTLDGTGHFLSCWFAVMVKLHVLLIFHRDPFLKVSLSDTDSWYCSPPWRSSTELASTGTSWACIGHLAALIMCSLYRPSFEFCSYQLVNCH